MKKRFIPWLVAALIGLGLVVAPPAGAQTTRPQIHVPSTIDDTCTTDATAGLNAFLASVPSGDTVEFPTDACYLVSNSTSDLLTLSGVNNLVLYGHGTTFEQNSYNGGSCASDVVQPVLSLTDNTDLLVQNFTLEGPNTCGGDGTEGDVGVMMRENNGVTLNENTINNVDGDGLDVYPSTPGIANLNVVVDNSTIEAVGYHAIVPESVNGFTFENSTILQGNIDAEVDYSCLNTWPNGCGTMADPTFGMVNFNLEDDSFPNGLQVLDGMSCMPVGTWAIDDNNFGTGGLDFEADTTYSLSLPALDTCGQYDGLRIVGNTSTGTSIHACCGSGSPYILVQGWASVDISQNHFVYPTNLLGAIVVTMASDAVILDNTFTNAPGIWFDGATTGWPASDVGECGNTYGPAATPEYDATC